METVFSRVGICCIRFVPQMVERLAGFALLCTGPFVLGHLTTSELRMLWSVSNTPRVVQISREALCLQAERQCQVTCAILRAFAFCER